MEIGSKEFGDKIPVNNGLGRKFMYLGRLSLHILQRRNKNIAQADYLHIMADKGA
jgi:hypothetical protein